MASNAALRFSGADNSAGGTNVKSFTLARPSFAAGPADVITMDASFLAGAGYLYKVPTISYLSTIAARIV